MRCYFVRGGHIFEVEVFNDKSSDAEAIKHSAELFAERAANPDGGNPQGFELWDGTRLIHRYLHRGISTGGIKLRPA